MLPYPSHTYPHAAPAHLYLLARVLGGRGVAVESATILEVGCASGANLIPHAIHYPHATFIGVDIDREAIAQASSDAVALGLQNISFHAMSLQDIGDQFGALDYVIAHGVYSWVDGDVSAALLDLCTCQLSDDGLAYVSYNVLPGWSMVANVRDMLCFVGEQESDLVEKVKLARTAMDVAVKIAVDNKLDTAPLFEEEYHYICRSPDGYVAQEYLANHNHAFYFKQFIQYIDKKDLNYVSDALMAANDPDQFMTYEGLIRYEQYRDFSRQRRFRASIMSKHKPKYSDLYVSWLPDHTRVMLNMVLPSFRQNNPQAYGMEAVMSDIGDVLSPLGSVGMTIVQLATALRCSLEQLKMLVVDLAFQGVLRLSLDKVKSVLVVSEYPKACAWVRLQAARSKEISTPTIERVVLADEEQEVLCLLNGQYSIADLISIISSNFNQAEVKVDKGQKQALEAMLQKFAVQGMLVA